MSSHWIRVLEAVSAISVFAVAGYQWLVGRSSRRRPGDRGGDGGSPGDWFVSNDSGHHAHSGGWDGGTGGDSGGGDGGGGDGGGGGD